MGNERITPDELAARLHGASGEAAIDLAIAYFNDVQTGGRWADYDAAFDALDPAKMNSSVCVSALGITIRGLRTAARRRFYNRTWAEIRRAKGWSYARGLLKKYA